MKINNINEDLLISLLSFIILLLLSIYVYVKINNVMYLLACILPLISCLIWIIMRTKLNVDINFNIKPSQTFLKALTIIYFILFSISIICIYLRPNIYERPLIYFVLVTLMVAIVFSSSFFYKYGLHYIILLIEIILIGINLEFTQQLIFPSVTGIDPAWHMMFIQKIFETHYLPPEYSYSFFPLRNLDVAINLLITNLNYNSSVIFSISFCQIVIDTLFIFLIATYIFNDKKIGLLSALFLSIADEHVFFGWWSTPNTYAFIYIPMIIYLIFKLKQNIFYTYAILIIFLFICLVLSHTVTSLLMLALIFILCLYILFIQKFSNYNIIHQLKINMIKIPLHFFYILLALFTIVMISWWVYASGSINDLVAMIMSGFSIETLNQNQNIFNYTTSYNSTIQFYSYIGIILFFSISFIGSFFALYKKPNFYYLYIVIAGLTITFVGFLSLIMKKEILNVRIWYLSELLLVIPLVISIILIINMSSYKIYKLIVGLLVILFIFTLIISPTSNMDNTTFIDKGLSAFTESELMSAQFFSQNSNGLISSDYDYCTNPSSSIFMNYYNVQQSRIVSLDNELVSVKFDRDGVIKIIRNYIIERPFRLSTGVYNLNYNPNNYLYSFNKIYDSNTVTAYL